MSDQLLKTVTKDGHFRAYALTATDLVTAAADAHQSSPIASTVLGRALIGSLLTASSVLKGDETMHIQMNGRGPIGNIVVEANAKAIVRGYVTNPQLDSEPFKKDDGQYDVPPAVGVNGSMQVAKMAPYANPFIGQVQLVTGEIGDEFTYYLAQSEQIPSAVGVSVFLNEDGSVGVAGGFLIQTLPGATDEVITELEEKLAQMPAISHLLLEGYTPLQLLEELLGKDQLTVLSEEKAQLAPEPKKESYAKTLATLPAEEIQAMIDEDGGAEVVGKFSGRAHYFTSEELEKIIEEINRKQQERSDE